MYYAFRTRYILARSHVMCLVYFWPRSIGFISLLFRLLRIISPIFILKLFSSYTKENKKGIEKEQEAFKKDYRERRYLFFFFLQILLASTSFRIVDRQIFDYYFIICALRVHRNIIKFRSVRDVREYHGTAVDDYGNWKGAEEGGKAFERRR